MVTFVQEAVTVQVPATSANLGPGFDTLGIAWSLHDRLTAQVREAGLEIVVTGEGADQVPTDDSHLVVRSMNVAFDLMGGRPAGLRLECENVIRHSRGMGSSSAAIVAGLLLARGLVAGGELLLEDDALFRAAAEIEGHPDNVAPALYGGFTLSGAEGDDFAGDWFTVQLSVDPRVAGVLMVPPTPVPTALARGLLPASVPHEQAAQNSGRTALLVAALGSRPELLLTATRDLLHQDHRASAMPQSHALVQSLRADGFAAVISGAGPTVLVLIDASQADPVLARLPQGWTAHRVEVDHAGGHVL